MKDKKESVQMALDLDEIQSRHFAFTGKLRRFTRAQAVNMVELLGGEADQTVKKETDYLVLGKNYQIKRSVNGKSIKYRKAEEMIEQGSDIKMIPEQDFYSLLRDAI